MCDIVRDSEGSTRGKLLRSEKASACARQARFSSIAFVALVAFIPFVAFWPGGSLQRKTERDLGMLTLGRRINETQLAIGLVEAKINRVGRLSVGG
jgi:hypothetical protein